MKILVTYYSSTGNTKNIAEAIAAGCGADLEQIQDTDKRAESMGYLRFGYEAMAKCSCKIEPPEHDPGQYDLVIVGSPIWALNMPPPTRAYVTEQGSRFKSVAFFCTQSYAGGDGIFKEMAEICGKQPIATLIVSETDLKYEREKQKVPEFCDALNQIPEGAHAAT